MANLGFPAFVHNFLSDTIVYSSTMNLNGMNKRAFLTTSFGAALLNLLVPFKSFSSSRRTQTTNWSRINIAQVNEDRIKRGGPYLSFINRESLKTGLYVLPKNSEDKQNPHELDEVYYIIEGNSKFFVDGEVTEVREGDVIYVKSAIEHRFVDIEKDLKILVFFSEMR